LPISTRAELLEALASIEHDRWSHWQKYLHSRAKKQSDGSLVIAPEDVERWEKQMNSPYEILTDEEKDSDRKQVMNYLPIVERWFSENGDRA